MALARGSEKIGKLISGEGTHLVGAWEQHTNKKWNSDANNFKKQNRQLSLYTEGEDDKQGYQKLAKLSYAMQHQVMGKNKDVRAQITLYSIV